MATVEAYVRHMAMSWRSNWSTIANKENVSEWIWNDVQRAGGLNVGVSPDLEFSELCLEAARELGPDLGDAAPTEEDVRKWVADVFDGSAKFFGLKDMLKACRDHPEIGQYCDPDCEHYNECTKSQVLPAVDSSEVAEIATRILTCGNPIDLIVDSCERYVIGGATAVKKLVCCAMVQLVPSSKGLHPKLNGESGSGKTHVVKVFMHHLPPESCVTGGLTPKALIYHKLGNMLFVFMDDYKQNDDMDTIIKQTTSNFHKQYTHRTVSRQKAETMEIGSEITWCITSVDSNQDIQVLNRQIPLNTDDTEELTKTVNDHTIECYGSGLEELFLDEMVEVCREMFRQLKALGHIPVRVPFWDRIEWLDNSNRRNPSIFMDLLIAITAINCFQRQQDEEGYYLSTEDDFEAAKALFSAGTDVEEMIKRLTKKEREFAEALIDHPDGMTRKELSEALGVSPARISQIARGDNGDGGLMQKLPGFDIADTTRRENEVESRRMSVYRLSAYDRFEGFDAVVRLSKVPVRSKPNSKTDKGSSSSSSSKYSKYIVSNNPLTDSNLTHPAKEPNSPNSDSRRGLTPTLPLPNSDENLTLDQIISEAERRGEAIRVPELVSQGFDELAICEALDAANWSGGAKAVWAPPSRQERM